MQVCITLPRWYTASGTSNNHRIIHCLQLQRLVACKCVQWPKTRIRQSMNSCCGYECDKVSRSSSNLTVTTLDTISSVITHTSRTKHVVTSFVTSELPASYLAAVRYGKSNCQKMCWRWRSTYYGYSPWLYFARMIQSLSLPYTFCTRRIASFLRVATSFFGSSSANINKLTASWLVYL